MTDSSSRLKRLLRFIELDPGNLMLRRDAIREALAASDWDTAHQLIDVRSSRGLVLRARCLHHLHRPEEAIADLQAHLAVSPEDAEASALLGLLLYEQGRSEMAREHVDAALRRNPQQVEALLTLASMQSEADERDAARTSFDTIVRLDPHCGRAWLGLALLELRETRADAAKRAIETAASLMPDHIGARHVLAWTNILLGDIVGAQVAFEQALSVDRTFGETHGGLAVTAVLQNREEEARLSARRALRLNPQSLAAKYAEILLLQRQGRHDDAKAMFASALALPSGRDGVQIRDLVAAQSRVLAGNSYGLV